MASDLLLTFIQSSKSLGVADWGGGISVVQHHGSNKPVQPFLFIALPQGMLGRVKGHMFLLGLYGNIAQP